MAYIPAIYGASAVSGQRWHLRLPFVWLQLEDTLLIEFMPRRRVDNFLRQPPQTADSSLQPTTSNSWQRVNSAATTNYVPYAAPALPHPAAH